MLDIIQNAVDAANAEFKNSCSTETGAKVFNAMVAGAFVPDLPIDLESNLQEGDFTIPEIKNLVVYSIPVTDRKGNIRTYNGEELYTKGFYVLQGPKDQLKAVRLSFKLLDRSIPIYDKDCKPVVKNGRQDRAVAQGEICVAWDDTLKAVRTTAGEEAKAEHFKKFFEKFANTTMVFTRKPITTKAFGRNEVTTQWQPWFSAPVKAKK